jgi:hypothetical protein
MKKLIALAFVILPLNSYADFDAKAFVDAIAEQGAKEKRALPPKYRVSGRCTFNAASNGGEGSNIGHKIDFAANNYAPFSASPSAAEVFELIEWVAGPRYGKTDVRPTTNKNTALENGWEVATHRTVDGAVVIIDVTTSPEFEANVVFLQKTIIMFDTRTSPIRAYLTRTPAFKMGNEDQLNPEVALVTQVGSCGPAEG